MLIAPLIPLGMWVLWLFSSQQPIRRVVVDGGSKIENVIGGSGDGDGGGGERAF